MAERYIPKVTEAAIPVDGGWTEIENEDVLVLSIPDWKEIVGTPITKSFRYVWMYDRFEDAYLLCFRINDQIERAIAFAREHAGKLLTNTRAYQPFSILITSESLEHAHSRTPFLFLPRIRLKRHPKAGW